MKCLMRNMLVGMLVTMFTPLLLYAGMARAASLACGKWSVVTSPNVGPSYNYLQGVTAVSANDVWAVGDHERDINGPFLTLTERWNGTRWSVVPSPSIKRGYSENVLQGVAAVTANDIWAVGWFLDVSRKTLIEHWNGTKWSIVSSPNVGYANVLNSVAAVSASDIWAVGYYETNSGVFKTLVEHWNGKSWSVVKSPNPNEFSNTFGGVAAVSATDVWAVGERDTTTLIEHWNGTQWSIMKSPNGGSNNNYLHGVAAVTTNNIWAVGDYYSASLQSLIEHWNGTNWTVVPSPNAGSSHNELFSVVGISATNAWAVGQYVNSSQLNATLIEHWNGTKWSIASSPNIGTSDNSLSGVAAVSPGSVWTVGDYFDIGSRNYLTLTEFYC